MGSKKPSSRHELPVISLDHLEEMDDCTLSVIRSALGDMFELRTAVEPKVPINQALFHVSSRLAGPPVSDADLHFRLRPELMPTIRKCVAPAIVHLHQRLEPGTVHELRLEGTPDGRPQWYVGLTRLGPD